MTGSWRCTCRQTFVPTGGTLGTVTGCTLGGAIGLTLGIRGGGMSSVESHTGSCVQLPLPSQSHSQVQLAWAVGAAVRSSAGMAVVMMRTRWTVGVGRGCASESR